MSRLPVLLFVLTLSVRAFAAPDPWRPADELIDRGEDAAAAKLAEDATGKDLERLPEYVAARRGRRRPPATREALDRAADASKAGDGQGMLDAPADLDPKGDSILAARVLRYRAPGLQILNRLAESSDRYRAAAEAAEEIGWLSMAAECWRESGHSAAMRGGDDVALARWTTQLERERRRESDEGVVASVLPGRLGPLGAPRLTRSRGRCHAVPTPLQWSGGARG